MSASRSCIALILGMVMSGQGLAQNWNRFTANAMTAQGKRPLHIAVLNNDKNMVAQLLMAGADANARDRANIPPLHQAMARASKEVTKLLIDAGANVNINGFGLDPPLHYAVIREHEEFAEIVDYMLAKGADINIRNRLGITPLVKAISFRNHKMVQLLADRGADITIKDNFGKAPLHYAVKRGDVKIADYLLSKGADVNVECKLGFSPLNLITMRDGKGPLDSQMMKYLLSKGAKENKNEEGNTPLHFACWYGGIDRVKKLVSEGADVNAQNGNRWTPLHCALIGRGPDYREIVRFLIENKANRLIRSKLGITPESLAYGYGDRDLLALWSERRRY